VRNRLSSRTRDILSDQEHSHYKLGCLFEEHCKATPFVADLDLAFWEAADRRVLKIHGSIANFGSIVATSIDYKKCQERLTLGILGGLLKTILATQTICLSGTRFPILTFWPSMNL